MLRRARFLRRFGHRRAVLAGFSAVAITYGSGLVAGYRPTFSAAYHLPVTGFGWAFITAGLFTLPRFRHDGLQYAAAELAAFAWALLLATHWRQPYGWTAGVSWFGIAAGLLLASAWPDAPRPPAHPPPVPTVEELTRIPGDPP